MMIMETKRLWLRELNQEDDVALAQILQDDITMTHYNGAFSDAEVMEWLNRQLHRYEMYDHRFGFWAVVSKETKEMIGQCGLTLQPWKDKEYLEIGYLLRRDHWHRGLATEAAQACKEFAFTQLQAPAVYSIIRDTNSPSQKVALRNGMHVMDEWVKHYRGVDMPHHLYGITRDEWESKQG